MEKFVQPLYMYTHYQTENNIEQNWFIFKHYFHPYPTMLWKKVLKYIISVIQVI